MPTDAQIDDAIIGYLTTADGRWRKVAMVIGQAAHTLDGQLPDGEAGYRQISRRIEALVDGGRLISQGDLSLWRNSEVCLPHEHA
jgi:hypothetical protein